MGYQVQVFSSVGNHYLQKSVTPNSWENHEGIWFYWLKGIATNKSNPLVRLVNWWLFNRQFLNYAKRADVTPKALILSSPPLTIANLIQPLRKTFQTKVLFEVRDLWPQSLVDLGNYSYSNPFIQWLSRIEVKAYQKSDYLIGNFPGFTQYLEDNYNNHLWKSKYIPQSFDNLESNIEKGTIEYDIGYAGSLSTAKDVVTLIEAVKILHLKGYYPKVLVIGQGTKAKRIHSEVKSMTNLNFMNKWLPYHEMLKYLNKCKVCYSGLHDLPLYNYRITPLKWLDYWMLKKPLLFAFSGNLANLPIEDFGWQVPAENPRALADQIQTILSLNKQTVKTKGEQGYQYMLTHHHPDLVGQAYQKLIKA